MTFSEYSKRSNAESIILFELDILKYNIQWVNIGAGIWEVNLDGLYPFVDSSLLDGFTSQAFFPIGSVMVDSGYQTKVSTLLLLTDTLEAYYYASDTKTLYIHLINNDEPSLHRIFVGVVNGFSYGGIVPVDSVVPYQGRLASIPDLGKSRDPLFFGKLSYPNGSVEIINADGYFDTFAEDNKIYGNQGRIKVGYKDLSIDDYITVFNGFVENSSVSEEFFSVTLNDKRKQLSKVISYTCSSQNALTTITDILSQAYNINYSAAYYDLTSWAAATASAPNISINISEDSPEKVISIIEKICVSLFGIFDVTEEGLFTFRFIDNTATAGTVIYKSDIKNIIAIEYDPSEVISSVRIGYAYGPDPVNSSQSIYTWLTDTSVEAAVFENYKTYNQQSFETYLDTITDAQALATKILNYSKDVHGITQNELPFSYYELYIGDIVSAQLNRPVNTMLGSKDCEIISVRYKLNFSPPAIIADLRIN